MTCDNATRKDNLMIKVNKLFSFFAIEFYKRNRKVEKPVYHSPICSSSHSISHSPQLPIFFSLFNKLDYKLKLSIT